MIQSSELVASEGPIEGRLEECKRKPRNRCPTFGRSDSTNISDGRINTVRRGRRMQQDMPVLCRQVADGVMLRGNLPVSPNMNSGRNRGQTRLWAVVAFHSPSSAVLNSLVRGPRPDSYGNLAVPCARRPTRTLQQCPRTARAWRQLNPRSGSGKDRKEGNGGAACVIRAGESGSYGVDIGLLVM
ncbi:hypothetical protein MAPG_00152 [Magnaporthiopsis poae ATCC 64411]|uniref:Uncharacterized protein n=1 Tax=Magnaporthiopsis poae (strain ATCC 64411 / 73-15) TaxID=644358 RepID=A0A0C4DK89_MAGP6|nr:hypothetical protein MAPG_00152 [Magnaporthiopsis poae ATCC 64411]